MTPEPTTYESLLADTRWLQRLLVGLVGDSHAAEDLYQEALLAAWAHGTTGPVNRSWLSRVARNLAASFHRRATLRTRVEASLPDVSSSSAPPELIVEAELQRRAVEAVLALDEPYRTTVLLRYMKGQSLAEAAQEMAVPVDTVRTRQRRALEILRQKLGVGDHRRVWLPMAWPGWAKVTVVMTMSKKSAVAVVSVLALLAVGWVGLWLPAGPLPPATPATTFAVKPVELGLERVDSTSEIAVPTKKRSVVAMPQTGSLEILLTWNRTGEPAAGIPLRLASRLSMPGLIQTSGPSGRVRYEDLRAGQYFLDGLHSKLSERFTLGDGEDLLWESSLEEGLHGTVIVEDSGGNPVKGALVVAAFVSTLPGWPYPLGHTDDHGEYAFRGLNGLHLMSAISESLGTSPSILLTKEILAGNTTLPIKLTLPGSASAISGRVYGPGGELIENALVIVNYGRGRSPGEGAHWWWRPLKATTNTDENGEFDLVGLLSEEVELVVLADGLAPYSRRIALGHGPLLDQVVVLEGGGLVRGRITDERGRPIHKATCHVVTTCSFSTLNPGVADDGTFLIEHVPSGKFLIEIESRLFLPWQKDLTIADGATYEIDAMLMGSEVQRCRLVDSLGDPLARWVFDRSDHRLGKTDENGCFDLVMQDGYHTPLSFRREGEYLGPLVHTFGRLQAQAGVLTLAIPSERMPTSWLSGRLLGIEGEPLAKLRVSCIQHDVPPASNHGWQVFSETDPEGAFRIGPLPQGRYELYAADARLLFPALEITLGVDDEQDFGALRGVRAAFLTLVLDPSLSRKLESHVLLDERGQVQGRDRGVSDQLVFGPLFPGTYRVAVVEGDDNRILKEVTLQAGDKQELRLAK